MTYDNQGTPTGILYTPTSSEWLTDPVTGNWYVNVTNYISLDSGIAVADQLIVVRQADFSSISPLIQATDIWKAWTCPNTNSSGSTMYTLDGSKVVMSSTASDYTFSRGGSSVQLSTFDPTTDTVYILRKTQDLTNYVSWVSGSHITAAQLNRAFTQLLNINQENAILSDNKGTLDPHVGTPSGICPLDSLGKIASDYIGDGTLASTTGNGISGDGTTSSPLAIDLDTDSGLVVSSTGLKADVVDNVTATDTNKPLSANQGKLLQDQINNLGEGINYKGSGDMAGSEGEIFYATLFGTPVTGDTVTHTGSGTTASASWGGITIAQYNTIRYDGSSWEVVDSSSYVKTDGTINLHADQKATTQTTTDSDTSVATTAFVHAVTDAVNLSELADVDNDTDDTTGNMIYWDGTSWADIALNVTAPGNTILSTGDGLVALSDVTDTLGPANGDFLKYDGTEWVASSETATAMSVVPAATAEADNTSVESTSGTSDSEGSDDSEELRDVLLDTNLGHNNDSNSSTIAIADFNGGIYKCSHIYRTPTRIKDIITNATGGNSSPRSVRYTSRVSIPNKRDITIRNGTFTIEYESGTSSGFLIPSWYDVISSGSRLKPTTTLSTAPKPGVYELDVANVMDFAEGCIVSINESNQTSDDYHDPGAEPVGEVRAESNKVIKVEYGKLYLKYPTKFSYRSGTTISTTNSSEVASNGFAAKTGATATITVPSDTSTANDDTVQKTLILTSADKKKWYLQSTSGSNDFTTTGTIDDPLLYAHDDTGTTLISNIAACINGHTELTTWVLAAVSSETLTLTQQDGSSNTFYGENANSRLEGTFIDNIDMANNDGTFLVSGLTCTHFTTGTTPRTENVVIENMTFENEGAREWKLGSNPVQYFEASGGTNGYAKITLPEDHNLPVGFTTIGRTDGFDITDNVASSFSPRWWADINGFLYLYVHPDDPKNVLRTQMQLGGQFQHGLQGRNDGDGTYTAPKTLNSLATGGDNCYLSVGGYSYGLQLKYSSGITIRNCIFKGFGIGIYLHNCENVLIEDCTFIGAGRGYGASTTGVYIAGASRNVKVRNCHISNHAYGIRVIYSGSSSTYAISPSDVLIENCTFSEITRPIYARDCVGLTIRNNDIKGGLITPTLHQFRQQYATYGIYAVGTQVLVEGNKIYGREVPPTEGVYSQLGFGVQTNEDYDYPSGDVTQDTYTGKRMPVWTYGIYVVDRIAGFTDEDTGVSKKVQGPIIRNNTVKDVWRGPAIYLSINGGHLTAPKKYDHVVVSNNHVTSGGSCIHVIAWSGGTVDGISSLDISNNTALHEPRVSYIDDYLALEQADGSSRLDSDAPSNVVALYWGNGESPPVITNTTICNNNIYGFSSTAAVYALRLGGEIDKKHVLDHALVAGNKVTGGTYCMYIDNPDNEASSTICRNTAIMGNFFSDVKNGVLHNSLKFLEHETNTFTNNHITMNSNTYG